MLEVDKKTFEDEVLKAEGYVFVDFFGDGCVPCQALMPFVHEMADKYGDKIKFTSLNTTKARRLAIGQKILGLPVMAIYKDGEKVEEVVKEIEKGETYWEIDFDDPLPGAYYTVVQKHTMDEESKAISRIIREFDESDLAKSGIK